MLIYNAIYFFALVFLLPFLRVSRVAPLLLLCLVTVFVGLRHEVGGDWFSYLLIYEKIGDSNSALEAINVSAPIYSIINWIAYNNELGIHFVNFTCALIFMSGLLFFSYKQYNPALAILVAMPCLVFIVAMGYTRQSVAIGILFFAYESLIEKRNIRFIFYVFLAAGFHFAALTMLSFLVINLRLRNIFFMTALSVAIFTIIIYFKYDFLSNKIASYLAAGGFQSKGALIRLALNVIPAVIFILSNRLFKKARPEYYSFMLWLSIGSVFLFFLALFFSTLADRLGLYFIIIQILVFANLPLFMNSFNRLIYYYVMFIFYFIFLQVWLATSYYAQNFWIPYSNALFR